MSLPVTTFPFSKFSAWHTFAFSVVGFAILFSIINCEFSSGSIIVIVVALGIFVYFIKTVFIPTINGKSALTITQDTVFIRKTNQTIYWQDVRRLYLHHFHFRKGYFIVFELSNGKNDVVLNTSFFSVEIEAVEKVLQDYLNNVVMNNSVIQ